MTDAECRYRDFTDPMLRAAAAQSGSGDDEIFHADTLRWMGYADQELTRLRKALDLNIQPGYASGRPEYARSVLASSGPGEGQES